MPLYAPPIRAVSCPPQSFMAQIDINPTVIDPNYGLVVYRRRPKGLSARRAMNDGPILIDPPRMGNFGQWEAIVSSAITAAGSIGGSAISAALAPRPVVAAAPPPAVNAAAPSNAAMVAADAIAAYQKQLTATVQTIAGQETTPATVPVASPISAAQQASFIPGVTNLELAIGAATLALVVVLLTRR